MVSPSRSSSRPVGYKIRDRELTMCGYLPPRQTVKTTQTAEQCFQMSVKTIRQCGNHFKMHTTTQYRKVLLNSFHLNGNTSGFHSQTQK